MTEDNPSNHQNNVFVISPENNKIIGQLNLIGNPVQVSNLFTNKGSLQRFEIIDGHESLKEVWSYQTEVLLRIKKWQRAVRIITYPTDGENQGYLDFTSEVSEATSFSSAGKAQNLTKKGFSFLQSLFGA